MMQQIRNIEELHFLPSLLYDNREKNKQLERFKMFWNVYLNGRVIDSVFFDKDCDEWYVKRALINHDGYNPSIQVRKAR
jgi:hypothetical protein